MAYTNNVTQDYNVPMGRYKTPDGQEYISKIGYAYNDAYYQQLIKEHKYDDAVKYMKNFTFTDQNFNSKYQASIASLSQTGAYYKALSNRLTSDQMDLWEFQNNLYVDNGFDGLEDNKYVKQFQDFKKFLGSHVLYNTDNEDNPYYHMDSYATHLALGFPSGKTYLFGWGWKGDWLMDKLGIDYGEDEGNTLGNYINRLGLSKEDLEAQGIKIDTDKNGVSAVLFDKSNPLANRLIVEYMRLQKDYPQFQGTFGAVGQGGMIQGLKENGKGGYDIVSEVNFNDDMYSDTYKNAREKQNNTYYRYELDAQTGNLNKVTAPTYLALIDNKKILLEHQQELKQGASEEDLIVKYGGWAKDNHVNYMSDDESDSSDGGDHELWYRDQLGIASSQFDDSVNINLPANTWLYQDYMAKTVYAAEDLVKSIDELKNDENANKEYTSIIGGELYDETERIRELYTAGYIDESTYYKEMALAKNSKIKQLKSTPLVTANVTCYTNLGNEEGDRTLNEADHDELAEISRKISNAADGDISLQAMVSNGQIGTLITLKSEYKDKDKTELSDPVQLFVPGMFLEDAQNTLNQDTSTRAFLEVNTIIDNNSSYTLDDGNVIEADSAGNLQLYEVMGEDKTTGRRIINNITPISKEDAAHLINKSLIKEGLAEELPYRYMNTNGEIVDSNAFEARSRIEVLAAANELYPDVPLTRADGTSFTEDELFHHKIKEDEVPQFTWNKVRSIYDLYDNLMTSASRFIKSTY